MTTVAHWLDREPGYAYVGRKGGGDFGNPFVAGVNAADRDDAIQRYETWFLHRVAVDRGFRAKVLALKGLQLVCHCAPLRCHAEVIKAWLDAQA